MTRSVFGQREAKELASAYADTLKAHAEYSRNEKIEKKRRRMRISPFASLFTASLAIIIAALAIMPQNVVAAGQIISKALPI
ncbi:MAG: hypothetical protein WAU86_24225 [Oricola sp.]